MAGGQFSEFAEVHVLVSFQGGYHAPVRYLAGALLLALSAQAGAEWWRADLESGQDGWSLAIGITAWMAGVTIYEANKDSRSKGAKFLAGWAAFAALMVFFPPARILMAALGLLFLFVVFWKGFLNR